MNLFLNILHIPTYYIGALNLIIEIIWKNTKIDNNKKMQDYGKNMKLLMFSINIRKHGTRSVHLVRAF